MRPDPQLISTGSKTLEEIMTLTQQQLKNNYAVVRLHFGDLTIYSVIHEQIRILAEKTFLSN